MYDYLHLKHLKMYSKNSAEFLGFFFRGITVVLGKTEYG